ncbi:TPA: hypothetical protein HA278_00145, partial [Candidatus Woesearchaeota archaeon]|nr:hypothetical protein [Candidatus Woesearchaeota archaeon]
MKILCLLKTTGYELHRTRWGSLPLFTKKHLQENHTVQQKAEKVLRDALHETDWNVTYVKDTTKHKFDCDDYDLVLTLGGDGTFLSAAQHCSSTSILGINSNPHTNPKKGSIGALTSVCIKDIRNVLQKIQQKQYNIETWPRLHAMINGKSLSQTAVNEIYIGPVEQDQTANFKITAGTKSE